MTQLSREHLLHGDRCISCNLPCPSPWRNTAPGTIPSVITSRLPQLKVQVELGESIRGNHQDYHVVICLDGESIPMSGDLVKRPDLKQPDGKTPRVCLIHEEGTVIDRQTNERFEGSNNR